MFFALLGLQKAYNFIAAPPSDEVLRQRAFRQAIFLLREDCGDRVQVNADIQNAIYYNFSDIKVTLRFRVATRPGQEAKLTDPYNVDFSSWKKLGRDLDILGDKFDAASRRAYPWLSDSKTFVPSKYTSLVKEVQKQASEEFKP